MITNEDRANIGVIPKEFVKGFNTDLFRMKIEQNDDVILTDLVNQRN